MAKAKSTSNDPEIVQVSHDRSEGDPFNKEIVIEGLAFRWVNVKNRERIGWGIWQPVWRDSAVGQEVATQLGATFDKFAGLAADTNLYHLGNDLALAYTSAENAAESKVAAKKKADDQLDLIGKNGQMRHTYISTNQGK